MSETINNEIPLVPESTIDPAAGLNLALNHIDALLQCSVIAIQDAPPGSPNEGDRYLVGTGSGAWSGHDDEVAVYLDNAWGFYTTACIVLNLDDEKIYINVGDTSGWVEIVTPEYLFTAYERHIILTAQVAGLSANQPTLAEVGTASGWQFASGGTQEELHFQWEIPSDWNGGDITVEIDWLPDSGAMTNPDAVKWVFEYRSVSEGETIDNGTIASEEVTYNTSTAQYLIVHSAVTFAYNDANQPLTVGDHIFVRCYRDTSVASDFAGTVVATAFEVEYDSIGIPTGN
jgi:hypothetical protein